MIPPSIDTQITQYIDDRKNYLLFVKDGNVQIEEKGFVSRVKALLSRLGIKAFGDYNLDKVLFKIDTSNFSDAAKNSLKTKLCKHVDCKEDDERVKKFFTSIHPPVKEGVKMPDMRAASPINAGSSKEKELSEQVTSLQKRLDTANQELTDLKKGKPEQALENEKLQAQLQKLTGAAAESQKALALAEQQLANLKNNPPEDPKLSESLKKSQEENIQLKTRNSELENENRRLQQELVHQESSLKESSYGLANIANESQKALVKSQEENSQLKIRNSELETTLLTTGSSLKEIKADAQKLQALALQTSKENKNLKKELEDAKKAKGAAEQALSAKQKEFDRDKLYVVSTMGQEQQRLTEALKKKDDEIAQLKKPQVEGGASSPAKEVKKETTYTQTELENITKGIAKEYEALEKQNEQLQQKVEQLQKGAPQMGDAPKKLADSEKERAELAAKLKTAEENVRYLETQIKKEDKKPAEQEKFTENQVQEFLKEGTKYLSDEIKELKGKLNKFEDKQKEQMEKEGAEMVKSFAEKGPQPEGQPQPAIQPKPSAFAAPQPAAANKAAAVKADVKISDSRYEEKLKTYKEQNKDITEVEFLRAKKTGELLNSLRESAKNKDSNYENFLMTVEDVHLQLLNLFLNTPIKEHQDIVKYELMLNPLKTLYDFINNKTASVQIKPLQEFLKRKLINNLEQTLSLIEKNKKISDPDATFNKYSYKDDKKRMTDIIKVLNSP